MRYRWITAFVLLLPIASRAGWSQLAPSPDASPVSHAPAAPEEDKSVATFKLQVNLVDVFFTVKDKNNNLVLVACNFTPVPRLDYRVGVPRGGFWRELLNSDARDYGGSGQGNMGGLQSAPLPWHGHPHSLMATLPPLGAVFFKR